VERRECLHCGVATLHHTVDLTAQAIDWTLFVCVDCGTRARTRIAQPDSARDEQRGASVAIGTARRAVS
jgi:transcription elongation factor Elf1